MVLEQHSMNRGDIQNERKRMEQELNWWNNETASLELLFMM